MFRNGYFRWVICGLLFLAATVNYMDRQVISILKPMIVVWAGRKPSTVMLSPISNLPMPVPCFL